MNERERKEWGMQCLQSSSQLSFWKFEFFSSKLFFAFLCQSHVEETDERPKRRAEEATGEDRGGSEKRSEKDSQAIAGVGAQ